MDSNHIVNLAMKHYKTLVVNGMGIWEGREHFVKNHFTGTDLWTAISGIHLRTLRKICNTGFDGTAYALSVANPTFPRNLKAAATIILNEYSGDVRNIWNDIRARNVYQLYDRLIQFPGIGIALARMGQFALVREYAVGGGEASKSKLCVKPDYHVCRVSYRAGLTSTTTVSKTMREIDALDLESPADFDLALWDTGRKYCSPSNPKCEKCPLDSKCAKKFD